MSDAFKPILSRLAAGQTLSDAEAGAFFEACLRGEPTPAQIGAAVTAMKLRGETPKEIAACAGALRGAARMLDHPYDVVDTCGTGGDGLHTLNISTAAAIVAAGAGLKVAKHGNRALSSKSGSSDVLAALGVNLQATAAQERRALDEAGITFLFAPAHHGAMRHVTPIRAELGFRTVFNLLGPLANPAGAKRQVLGVYDPRLLQPLAEVLGALGATHAWVVHGQGLDELTTTGETQVVEWKDGQTRAFTVAPEPLGLARVPVEALMGGEPEENAAAITRLLGGAAGPYRDVVLLNTAAALLVGGHADSLEEGLVQAALAIDSGAAARALRQLVAASSAPGETADA
ncbi:MAG TPA: anthranilate phosphoribosyltransferase [Caulobacteraceae bacterium]